jgi:Fur family iron response transcriptional regulator
MKTPHDMNTETSASISELVRMAGLRLTRQRITLGRLLFEGGGSHKTAEQLHTEVKKLGERISLATVYNTLHDFTRAGLLRKLAIDGSRIHVDTNTSNHNHFYVESNGKLIDIPCDAISVEGLPEPPTGTKIAHIDVIVRIAGI